MNVLNPTLSFPAAVGYTIGYYIFLAILFVMKVEFCSSSLILEITLTFADLDGRGSIVLPSCGLSY